jgi:phage FluMu protein Com
MAKRYQRGNQNLYIKEEQTTQWPKDTKGAIRICISKKNRQHNGQKIPKGNQNLYIKEEQTTQWPKDTKGAIRICISKKNRQHNGQKKMYKRTNNDLQNIHVKLKIE